MKTKLRYVYAVLIMIGFAVFVNGLAYIITRPIVIDEDDTIVSFDNNMKQSDAESVLAVIQAEGFDSAFYHYSTYKDIHDNRFHELRKAYLNARKDLFDYIEEASHNPTTKPYYMVNYENQH